MTAGTIIKWRGYLMRWIYFSMFTMTVKASFPPVELIGSRCETGGICFDNIGIVAVRAEILLDEKFICI